jgi:hypothetical protein
MSDGICRDVRKAALFLIYIYRRLSWAEAEAVL